MVRIIGSRRLAGCALLWLAWLAPQAGWAQPAGSIEENTDSRPGLVIFDPLWKDFHLKKHMQDEIRQHIRDWVAKVPAFRVIDQAERDRTLLQKRIFIMGTPDQAKIDDIATQAGWSYLLWPTFQGVPGRGIKITMVFRDLNRGASGLVAKEKTTANHLKALRDTARGLAQEAVREGAAAMTPPTAPPTVPAAQQPTTPAAQPAIQQP